MKKIIILLPLLLLGCTKPEFTPKERVEKFLSAYQNLDEEVLNDLNETVNNEINFNEEQKNKYLELMKNHYQGLNYEIKDEIIENDEATVIVEIEVKDYSKTLTKANEYLNEHKEEFYSEDGTFNETLYINYKLDKMRESNELSKYTLNIELTKIDNEWKIDDLSDLDMMKIQGIYEY